MKGETLSLDTNSVFLGSVINTNDIFLEDFFSSCPKWIQVARFLITENETGATEDIIKTLTEQCKLEATKKTEKMQKHKIKKMMIDSFSISSLRLNKISNIVGINALAPKNPLVFSKDKNISIIYGENGAGKTGYVRLLKHICNSRKKGTLHPNIFEKNNPKKTQTACVEYSKNNQDFKFEWTPKKKECQDLHKVDIFDSEYGSIFVEDEGIICYETPILELFTTLISVCDGVKKKLIDEVQVLENSIPTHVLPKTLVSTPIDKWLKEINANTSLEKLVEMNNFSEKDRETISELQEILSEKTPVEKIQTQQVNLNNLINNAKNLAQYFSSGKCQELIKSRDEMLEKKKRSEEVAHMDFRDEEFLNGIGNDLWKTMWNAAMSFSINSAYPNKTYPNLENEAKCVLCQQLLSDEAKKRLQQFDSFIKSEVEKSFEDSENKHKEHLNNVPNIIDDEIIKSWISISEISDEIEQEIYEFYNLARKYVEHLHDVNSNHSSFILEEHESWLLKAEKLLEDRTSLIENLEKINNPINLKKLQNELDALLAKEWITNNFNTIKDKIKKMKEIEALKKAIKLTDTTRLSKKKTEITKYQVTDKFINTFNEELKNLKAKHIKVQPVQSHLKKGQIVIKLQLKGCEDKAGLLTSILSEGERRIVSIAAFLSDISSRYGFLPIILDDPISSLDQEYEDATTKRLVRLSKNRQVIVFTHRLSTVYTIEEHAKSLELASEIICITNERWGAGEPSKFPLSRQNPVKALNYLINEELPKARTVFEKETKENYKILVEKLYKDFRIILENIIERELISGVVLRLRDSVQTKNKINNLAKITKDDCKLIEKHMTKKSAPLHSISQEITLRYPTPDEILKDFEEVKNWLIEFRKRK